MDHIAKDIHNEDGKMTKSKRKPQASKRKRSSGGILGLMDTIQLAKEGKSAFGEFSAPSGFRANISGKDYGPSHGQKSLTHANLMYGKRLVMTGKDKGKII